MKMWFSKNKKYLVDISLFLDIGAIDDTKQGVSHMVEHLLLSEKNKSIQTLINKNIYVNGYTTQDSMILQMKTQKHLVFFAVKTLLDHIFNFTISDKIFNAEKKLVLEEIKCNQPAKDNIGFMKFLSKISNKHIHSERGSLTSVKSITKRDVYTLYNKYIKPENSILSVTNNASFLTKQKLKRLTHKTKHISPRINFDNTFRPVFLNQNLNLSTSHLFFAINNNGMFDSEKHLFELFAIVFFSSLSPFWNTIRNELSLCYYIDYENIYIKNFGFLVLQIDAENKNIKQILNILTENLSINNLTKELFEKSKQNLLLRLIEDYNENINFEASLRKKLFNKKSNYKLNKKIIENISYSNFYEFCKRIITNQEYSILIQQ